MKILVTGASGLVGSHLVPMLAARLDCQKVYAVSRRLSVFHNPKIQSMALDLSEPGVLFANADLESVDGIVHLAGSPGAWYSNLHLADDLEQNVVTLTAVLEWAKQKKIGQMVLASTWQVYTAQAKERCPENFYALSKWTAEKYLRVFSDQTGIPYTILRMSWIYGPGMTKNPIYDLIAGRNQEAIRLFLPLEEALDFIYVEDVARACCAALYDKSWVYQTVNISSARAVSIGHLVKLLEQKTGKKYQIQAPQKQARQFQFDNAAARALGWRPQVNLEEGFLKTLEFFQTGRRNEGE